MHCRPMFVFSEIINHLEEERTNLQIDFCGLGRQHFCFSDDSKVKSLKRLVAKRELIDKAILKEHAMNAIWRTKVGSSCRC